MGSQANFSVGMQLEGLRVESIDLEKSRVEVKTTASTRATRKAQGEVIRKKVDIEKKKKSGKDAADGAPQQPAEKKPFVAVKKKPTEGWDHEAGRDLAALVVGEVVQGRITNVMYRQVWVDIGAKKDAFFKLPMKETREMKLGDTIDNLTI